jgi:nucleotide-binding universal stress UspA family protein
MCERLVKTCENFSASLPCDWTFPRRILQLPLAFSAGEHTCLIKTLRFFEQSFGSQILGFPGTLRQCNEGTHAHTLTRQQVKRCVARLQPDLFAISWTDGRSSSGQGAAISLGFLLEELTMPLLICGPNATPPPQRRELLAAVSFSEVAGCALPLARALATPFQASVRLIHVTPLPERLGDTEHVTGPLLDHALRRFCGMLGNVATSATRLPGGSIAQAIAEHARAIQASFLILSARPVDPSPEVRSCSTLYDLFRLAPCPVFAVTPRSASHHRQPSYDA